MGQRVHFSSTTGRRAILQQSMIYLSLTLSFIEVSLLMNSKKWFVAKDVVFRYRSLQEM